MLTLSRNIMLLIIISILYGFDKLFIIGSINLKAKEQNQFISFVNKYSNCKLDKFINNFVVCLFNLFLEVFFIVFDQKYKKKQYSVRLS